MTEFQLEAKRIEDRLSALAENTKVNGQTWRASYTKEDKLAKEMIRGWMEEIGLETREDAVGNLIGRLEGAVPGSGVIMTGSHRDTVKDGGKYDGAAGIVVAVEAVASLLAHRGRPEKTVEIVALGEEEGSRFASSYIGSKAIAGKLTEDDLLERDADGVTLAEAMKAAGYDPKRYAEAAREDVTAYVELHAEQGPRLYGSGTQIGVVENIVGIFSYEVTVRGQQNHAGTTPMDLRRDPVLAAAAAILDITSVAREIQSTATLTVGSIETKPGMSNVIAGEVKFLIDLRSGDEEKLREIDQRMTARIHCIAEEGFAVEINSQCREMPARLDSELVSAVAAAAEECQLSFIRMDSGAGHDAQVLADTIPSCMLFMKSVDGVSHSPEEYTDIEGLAAGFACLRGTLKRLAW